MDPDKVKAALEALKAGDGEAALKILEDLFVQMAGGEAEPDPVEPGAEALAESAEPKPAPEVALTEGLGALLIQLTGASTPAQAVEIFRSRLAEIDSIHTDRATIELSERRGLIADLVKLGIDTPATAWADTVKLIPCKRLAAEPIAELRDRVTSLKASTGGKPRVAAPPAGAAADGREFKTSHGVVTLSASEIKNCEAAGAKLEAYAENKAIRLAARKVK